MRFSSALFATSLATSAEAAKLLICSDSTTANYATGNALQGWGYYIGDYLGLTISNLAKNGRSTRSFINEGLWSTLLSSTASGDFVVIEMGHNDDGDPTTSDRATLPGTGENTVTVTTTTGTKEVVHTFGWYLRKMIADVKAKGATPIISGMVNRNYWTGNTLQSNWPFANDAKSVADAAGVEYIDHTKYSVALFQAMGSTKAKTYFPNDNTHTNWDGAKLNAQTFVQAIKYKCGAASKLKSFINSAGNAITNPGQQGSCPASPTTKPATTIKTSSAPAASQTGKPGAVPQYGQCGGSGWTGGTVCVSPYKCTVANEWYSQCL